MRTVLKIFRRDVRRLAGNPVAIVITLGVALIPSLYAWFNIVANWDPYENTSTVPVAVVNEDEGAEVAGLGPINAGDMIAGELKENGQLGWTFVGEQEALDGVRPAAPPSRGCPARSTVPSRTVPPRSRPPRARS